MGRVGRRRQFCLFAALVCSLSGSAARAGGPNGTHAPVQGYRVLHEYAHDPEAFTQGLIFSDGALYESTGLEGRSSLRRVEIETGRVLEKVEVERPYFAEGLAAWNNRLIQLTWLSHLGFVYDQSNLRRVGEFRYEGEGWGLTTDGENLILSDGSSTLRFLDPVTFKVRRSVQVTDDGSPVNNINELEYARGELLANIWQTDLIARISPASGKVLSFVDLSGLLSDDDRGGRHVDVLNGIAYDAAKGRLFVTGKLWPKLFEIEIHGLPK